MEKIKYENWPRRQIYEFFSHVSNPFYMITIRQDVTGIYHYAKANRLSFYHTMCWCVCEAINRVDAFHYVCREGEIFRLDRRNPSFTDLKKGEECFQIITLPMQDELRTFCAEAARQLKEQTVFINTEEETDDLIYLSCTPWFDLTAYTNERDILSPNLGENSIPSVAWGKYTEENGRIKLGLSMEVNHRFIDGIHLGRFAQGLTEISESLDAAAGASAPSL